MKKSQIICPLTTYTIVRLDSVSLSVPRHRPRFWACRLEILRASGIWCRHLKKSKICFKLCLKHLVSWPTIIMPLTINMSGEFTNSDFSAPFPQPCGRRWGVAGETYLKQNQNLIECYVKSKCQGFRCRLRRTNRKNSWCRGEVQFTGARPNNTTLHRFQ